MDIQAREIPERMNCSSKPATWGVYLQSVEEKKGKGELTLQAAPKYALPIEWGEPENWGWVL